LEFVPSEGGECPPCLPPGSASSVLAPPRPTVVGGRIRRTTHREVAQWCLTRLPASFKRHRVAIGMKAFASPTRFGCLRAADAARWMDGTPSGGTRGPRLLSLSLFDSVMSWYGLQLYCTSKCTRPVSVQTPLIKSKPQKLHHKKLYLPMQSVLL
jgi:hypothetical protein